MTRQGRSLELVPAFVCLRVCLQPETLDHQKFPKRNSIDFEMVNQEIYIYVGSSYCRPLRNSILISIVSFCNEMNCIRGKMSPDEKFFFFFSYFFFLVETVAVGFLCWVLMFRRPGSLRECVSRRTSPSRRAAVFPCYTMDIYVDK